MILSDVQAATVGHGHTLAIAEDEASVTHAALHALGGRLRAEDGEEVGTRGGAGGGAVGVVAVWRTRESCGGQRHTQRDVRQEGD